MLLIPYFSIAKAEQYAGRAGWLNEHSGDRGKLEYVYETSIWLTGERRSYAPFSLTLKFDGYHGLVLPKEFTIKALLFFEIDQSYKSGGIFLPREKDDYSYNSRPIGWFNCSLGHSYSECHMKLRGVKGLSDEPYSWLEVTEAYEYGRLCYLSGKLKVHYKSEDTVVWHSKNLCK